MGTAKKSVVKQAGLKKAEVRKPTFEQAARDEAALKASKHVEKQVVKELVEQATKAPVAKVVVKEELKFRTYRKQCKVDGKPGLTVPPHTTKWGAEITIWNGYQASIPEATPDTNWVTKCETHKKQSLHKSWRLAAYASAHPDTFCDQCGLAKTTYMMERDNKQKALVEKKVEEPKPTAKKSEAKKPTSKSKAKAKK